MKAASAGSWLPARSSTAAHGACPSPPSSAASPARAPCDVENFCAIGPIDTGAFTVSTASLGLGQLCGPAVGGVLADWFGPSGVGWFAAAIYGAAMLAAAGDGFFGRTWTPTP